MKGLVTMGDNNKIIVRKFFPKPGDPESTATVVPSFLIRRERVRSSTLDMEYYTSKIPEEDRTFKTAQKMILH